MFEVSFGREDEYCSDWFKIENALPTYPVVLVFTDGPDDPVAKKATELITDALNAYQWELGDGVDLSPFGHLPQPGQGQLRVREQIMKNMMMTVVLELPARDFESAEGTFRIITQSEQLVILDHADVVAVEVRDR